MEQLTLITPESTNGWTDARGQIANVLRGTEFSHLAVVTCKAGSVRGNHWHPEEEQYMFLLSGKYLIYTRQAGYGGDAPVSVQMVNKPWTLAYCPPGVIHAYRFLEDTVFLNIGKDDRDTARFKEHTLRVPLIDENGEVVW